MKASYARKIKQLTAELATFPEPDAAPEPSKATAKKAKSAKFDNELIVTMSSRAAGQSSSASSRGTRSTAASAGA